MPSNNMNNRGAVNPLIENLRAEILETLRNNILFTHTTAGDPIPFDRELHRVEVLEELEYHLGQQSFSDLFISQLVALHGQGFVEIDGYYFYYEIENIYHAMKQLVAKKVAPKPFRNKKSKLFQNKVQHIHHNQTFYMEDNQIRFFEKTFPTEESVILGIREIAKRYPDADTLPTFMVDNLNKSLSWDRKTGEWILFQETNEGYHFVALGIHGETGLNDEKIYKKVETHLRQSQKAKSAAG